MSEDLKNIVEAVLLASDGPVKVARIQSLFDEETRPEAGEIHAAISALQAECENRGIELCKIGSGFRYQTRQKYAGYLRKLHTAKPPRLSRALLETLSIIAYRQPVTRGDIEEVRGVAVSSDIMQRLIEREWVREVGVRDVPGRPALFGTTDGFLSYFNLTSLKDLPDLLDQRALGEIAGEMETPLPPEVLATLEADGETDEEERAGRDENGTGQPDGDAGTDEHDEAGNPELQKPGHSEEAGQVGDEDLPASIEPENVADDAVQTG